MAWVFLLGGLGAVAWGIVRYRTESAALLAFLQQPGRRAFTAWIGAGLLALLAAGVLPFVDGSVWWSSPHTKVPIPRRVLESLDKTIEKGWLARADAADLNEWLNYDVRLQKRDLQVIQVEPEVAFPGETVRAVLHQRSANPAQQKAIVQYLADIAADKTKEFAGYPAMIALGDIAATGKVSQETGMVVRDSLNSLPGAHFQLSPTDFGVPDTHVPMPEDHPTAPSKAAPAAAPAIDDGVPMPPAP